MIATEWVGVLNSMELNAAAQLTDQYSTDSKGPHQRNLAALVSGDILAYFLYNVETHCPSL